MGGIAAILSLPEKKESKSAGRRENESARDPAGQPTRSKTFDLVLESNNVLAKGSAVDFDLVKVFGITRGSIGLDKHFDQATRQ